MKQVLIYGASDDLVEMEGDIEQEYSCYDSPCRLLFDDGSIVEAVYDDGGIWRLKATTLGKGASASVEAAPDVDDDGHSNTDKLLLKGKFTSVVEDKSLADMRDWLSENVDELSDEVVTETYRRCACDKVS